MKERIRTRWLLLAVLGLAIAGLLVIAGCGGSTTTTPAAQPTATTAATNFDKIAGSMNDLLNNPANLNPISSTDLNKLLTSGNANNIPLVIDVRSATDYSTASSKSPGHIPSAINIPYKKIADPASVSQIKAELAKHSDNTIVLHCYTGHTQSIALAILYGLAQEGQLGTPAPKIEGLAWGMMGYNSVEKPPAYANTFPLVTTTTPAATTYSLPNVSGNLQTQAEAAATNMPGRINVDASGQTINKKPLSSYTIVDIRSADEFAKGHMEGAINLPYQDLFKKAGDTYPNLAKIDRSKQILVVGNRQYEEEAVAVGLNMLGISQSNYNTGALGFGIATWNNTVGDKFTSADKHTFPVVTGTAPGNAS